MNSWISVEKMLPDKSGYYLVYCGYGSGGEKDIFSCYFDELVSSFGKWNTTFDPFTLGAIDQEWESFSAVSHWMNIPELPEQDDMCSKSIDYKIQAIDRYGHV